MNSLTAFTLFTVCSLVPCYFRSGSNKNKANNINQIDKNGQTALMKAVNYLDVVEVKKLLDAGASKEIQDADGNTALMLAVMSYCGEFQCGCINDELERKKIIVELLSKGSTKYLDTINNKGMTALMLAVIYEYNQIIKIIVGAGASLNIIGKFGWSAIMWAISNKYISIVKYLIDTGSSFGIIDNYNYSPIMRAVIERNVYVIRLLLEAGAPLQVRNDDGESVIDIALQKISCDRFGPVIVKMLLEFGAVLSQDNIEKYSKILDKFHITY